MACYHPITGYRARVPNRSGKYSIVFSPNQGYKDLPITVPCGQCIGCRLERSRQWAIRCVHEASLHDRNCFITLTYDNQHLPTDLSLDLDHWQRFMKRLRKKYGAGIRFFHCGEYGELYKRPHYHACIFGFDFDDKIPFKTTGADCTIYTSDELCALWPYGFCSIGDVTFESAAYVARYVMKKVTGPGAADHYGDRKPEYVTMSRRPGIGSTWYKRWKSDVYPSDEVIVRGVACRPPKFYDSMYEVENPDFMTIIKGRRKRNAKKYADNNTPERLCVRETVKAAKISLLSRVIE